MSATFVLSGKGAVMGPYCIERGSMMMVFGGKDKKY